MELGVGICPRANYYLVQENEGFIVLLRREWRSLVDILKIEN